jgi:hypothetical protein
VHVSFTSLLQHLLLKRWTVKRAVL